MKSFELCKFKISHKLLYLQRALAAMINQVHCLKIEGYRGKNCRNNIITICKHKILSLRFLYNKFCYKYFITIIINIIYHS